MPALAVLAAAATPSLAQHRPTPTELYAEFGWLQRAEFGADVAVLGDLDGDGCAEWIAGRTGPPNGSRPPQARVHSGRDGSLLYVYEGTGSVGTLFLESLCDLGDVDGDGVSDFAFGNSNAPVGGQFNVGAVTVYSGATGLELYVREGITSFGAFGASLAALGDVDGDGVSDFVVGAIGTLNENAWVVSGADGTILYRVRGPTNMGDIEFGWAAAATGDLDGDSIPDFAVGTLSGGFVDFRTGSTGARLRRVPGGASFGSVLADLGDLDRDGCRDLLVGEPAANTVHVLSGRSGETLATIAVPDGVSFGTSVARAGDLDHDHVPDFLVGDPGFAEGRGRVLVFSGRKGRILYEVVGALPNDRVGSAVAGGADLSGDGRPDFLVGATGVDTALPGAGEVKAWSGWRASPAAHDHGGSAAHR